MNPLRYTILLSALTLGACGGSSAPSAPAADGAIDLSGWDLDTQGPVQLSGQWGFVWGALLTPDQPTTGTIAVPGAWTADGAADDAWGHGTYRLELQPPDGEIALLLPPVSTAHRLIVDGAPRESAGLVGTSAGAGQPDGRAQIVGLGAGGEAPIAIDVQVSNYHHRVGGMRVAPVLGRPEQVLRLAAAALAREVFSLGVLLVIGLTLTGIYASRRRDPAKLWFGLFCLILALRTAVDVRGLQAVLPVLPWELALRLKMVCNFLAMGSGALAAGAFFPKDAPWALLRGLAGVAAAAALVTFLLPAAHVTSSVLGLMALTLAALPLVALTFGRALRARRPLIGPLALGAAVFFAAVLHDQLRAAAVIDSSTELASQALLFVVALEAFALVRSFTGAFNQAERLSEALIVANRSLEATNLAVERFVPYAFLDLLQRSSIQQVARGDSIRLEMSVMFCDLRSFTTLIEGLGPEASYQFINDYLIAMEPPVHAEGGFINQYLGDCIMALFPGVSDGAVRATAGMLQALAAFNSDRAERGLSPVRVGIGVAAGPITLGTIGGGERLDNSVIGDPVNLAARLEGLTKVYGAQTILDAGCLRLLENPDDFALREIDRVVPKGKTEPVRIYEVLDGLPDDERAAKSATAPGFAAALAAYAARDFDGARAGFVRCLEGWPADKAAALYVRRCERLIAEPPGAGWRPVAVFDHK